MTFELRICRLKHVNQTIKYYGCGDTSHRWLNPMIVGIYQGHQQTPSVRTPVGGHDDNEYK